MKLIKLKTLLTCLFVLASFQTIAHAQTTSFTYQGRLTDNAAAASGAFDFEFALYDLNGNPLGDPNTRGDVQVTNGVFTVDLDFGAAAFPGAARTLEIRVRRGAETGDYTALSPRQSMTSAPYAIRALHASNTDIAINALKLGGIAANNFVQSNDSRLSDSRQPSAGSGNYIQNQTEAAQTAANFNISGTGAANNFNAQTGYDIGDRRVLSIGSDSDRNVFVGTGAGAGDNNTGTLNTFAGRDAGFSNTTGRFNSFFGANIGYANTTGGFNSFFGSEAGFRNTTGSSNSFLGMQAGLNNTTGGGNVFVGTNAGNSNTIGGGNAFVGTNAGTSNTTGIGNVALGDNANFGAGDLTNATVIGAGATVSTSNTVVLGRTADTVRVPGNFNLTGSFTGNFTVPAANVTGTLSAAQIPNLDAAKITTGIFADARLSSNVATLSGAQTFTGAKTFTGNIETINTVAAKGGVALFDIALQLRAADDFFHMIRYLPGINGIEYRAFDDHAWFNGRNDRVNMQLSSDGNLRIVGDYLKLSDARYKTNVQTFARALETVKRLRGVTFNWQPELNKTSDAQVGFIAQEVEAVLPSLVATGKDGYKSVAYANAVPVLVEAVKEQQAQIETQAARIEQQQKQIDELKNLLCIGNPNADVCRQQ